MGTQRIRRWPTWIACARAAWLAIVLPAFVALAATADAQPRKAGASAPSSGTTTRTAAPKKPAPATDAGTPATVAPSAALMPIAPAALATAATVDGRSGDAGGVEVKTLDGGTRAFRFSELDIEGQLKSPQLVYFLRRVRAEFAAGDLGHRTFLREMSETRKESTF
jgi:hypothetical protein